jgi:hypothetical protein
MLGRKRRQAGKNGGNAVRYGKVEEPMARSRARYVWVGMALGAAALVASQFADLRRYMRMRSM